MSFKDRLLEWQEKHHNGIDPTQHGLYYKELKEHFGLRNRLQFWQEIDKLMDTEPIHLYLTDNPENPKESVWYFAI